VKDTRLEMRSQREILQTRKLSIYTIFFSFIIEDCGDGLHSVQLACHMFGPLYCRHPTQVQHLYVCTRISRHYRIRLERAPTPRAHTPSQRPPWSRDDLGDRPNRPVYLRISFTLHISIHRHKGEHLSQLIIWAVTPAMCDPVSCRTYLTYRPSLKHVQHTFPKHTHTHKSSAFQRMIRARGHAHTLNLFRLPTQNVIHYFSH